MYRRRRDPRVTLLLVLLPCVLVAGLWLGGHPDRLPEPVRDVFVDERAQLLDEALDAIERDYYRGVDRNELDDASVRGAVESLGDRFSAYFDPRSFARFQEATEG